MNKTLTIAGQTIELPFTEAWYNKVVDKNDLDYLIQYFKSLENNEGDAYDEPEIIGIAIGLHLAEKEKQGEIERLTKRIDYYENELDKINNRLRGIIGGYSL